MYRLESADGSIHYKDGTAGDILDTLIRHEVRLTTLSGNTLRVVLA